MPGVSGLYVREEEKWFALVWDVFVCRSWLLDFRTDGCVCHLHHAEL